MVHSFTTSSALRHLTNVGTKQNVLVRSGACSMREMNIEYWLKGYVEVLYLSIFVGRKVVFRMWTHYKNRFKLVSNALNAKNS